MHTDKYTNKEDIEIRDSSRKKTFKPEINEVSKKLKPKTYEEYINWQNAKEKKVNK